MRYPTASVSIGLGVGLSIALLVASVVAVPAGPAQSREQDKTLKLFFGHTGEKGEFTFKRNGSYDRSELARINKFLRDWRKDEPARMDPQLLDLIWAIYRESGSRDYIYVVSAYRSPATNEMLRRRSSGVAKNSQHRLGKAMDWYLPDVPLAKLRTVAMKMQGGGVGYYPRSGSPFVHTDTGNVRAWPRMTRQQLIALFPNGNTLHLPADGKPLPGYETALARRKASGGTVLAYLDTGSVEVEETDRTGTDTSNGWLRRIFPGGGRKEDAAAAPEAAPAAAEETETAVASVEEGDDNVPRPPRARPDGPAAGEEIGIVLTSIDEGSVAPEVPLPRMRPEAATGSAAFATDGADAIASLTERMSQESVTFMSDPAARPIELAFAAASETPQPSEADRAILTAFAALNAPGVVRDADPALAAAANRVAAGEDPEPQALTKLALAYSGGDLPPETTAAPASEAATGIVLGPADPADYQGDANDLVHLINADETPANSFGELAMPAPAAEFYVAPQDASDVADLRGRSGPPTEHFSPGAQEPGDDGFFTRLFASLIE